MRPFRLTALVCVCLLCVASVATAEGGGTRTLVVNGKMVSCGPAAQGAPFAEFTFDSKGYRNSYSLNCATRQFLWTKNVLLSTGQDTGNSAGAEWHPISARSAIANAAYQAACSGIAGRGVGAGDKLVDAQGDGTGHATPRDIGAYCHKVGNSASSGEGNNYPGTLGTVWRCMHHQAYICRLGASGRACMRMNTSRVPNDAIRTFCQQNPNSTIVPMSVAGGFSSTWRCQGPEPVIMQSSDVDERGYLKGSWFVVSASHPPEALGRPSRPAQSQRIEPLSSGRSTLTQSRLPQGTHINISSCAPGSRFDGYGTTFKMQVPATLQQLASTSFVLSLLNGGMQQAIDDCNRNAQSNAHNNANRFVARICNVPCTSAVIGDDYLIFAQKDIGSTAWHVTNYATAMYRHQQERKETLERAPSIDTAALCTFIKDGQTTLRALIRQAKNEANPLRQADAMDNVKGKLDALNARLKQLIGPDYTWKNVKGIVGGIEAQVYSQGPAANLSVKLPNCQAWISFRFIDWNGQGGSPGDELGSLAKWRPVLENVVAGTPVVFSAVILRNGFDPRYDFPGDTYGADAALHIFGRVTELRRQ